MLSRSFIVLLPDSLPISVRVFMNPSSPIVSFSLLRNISESISYCLRGNP